MIVVSTRRLAVVCLLAGLLCGLGAAAARAHAILIDSTPAVGAEVPAGVVQIRLRFNSRIDAGRSRLTLVGSDGAQTVLPLAGDAVGVTLNSVATLRPGAQRLRWQVLAVDGHITRGDVPITAVAR